MKLIIYGEKIIYGLIHQVHVLHDIMYQQMLNGLHWKIIYFDQHVHERLLIEIQMEHQIENEHDVIDYDGNYILQQIVVQV